MSSPAAQALSSPHVNAVYNPAIGATHSPSPCAKSLLNRAGREWWIASASTDKARAKPTQRRRASDAGLQVPSNWPKDVVYLTQNLVASSVPDSVARRYVLQPSTSPDAQNPVLAQPSSSTNLPRATHNDGRAEVLYTSCIQKGVPLVIWPIGQDTAWDPESYHSTSRALKCHPAIGSFGLFAAADIPPNTFLRPYLGVLHTKADADFHSTYDLSLCHDPRLRSRPESIDPNAVSAHLVHLSLDAEPETEEQDPTALYLDSRYWGNESRFVNDYRGIASRPNVEFRSFIQLAPTPSHPLEETFQMGLFSIRPIRKGQELLINYGKSYWIHHQQLDQIEKAKSTNEVRSNSTAKPSLGASASTTVDPIQAMLQRSRLRVSRTALSAQRPPQPPPSRTSPHPHPHPS